MQQSSPSFQNKDAYMVYQLGGRRYAAPVSNVIEVVLSNSIMPVSDSTSYIAGILHFRGRVIPVIDTVKRLSLSSNKDNPNTYTVVFEVETDGVKRTFGALIDKVLSVTEFSHGEIKDVEDLPSEMTTPSYVKGVVENDGSFIIVVSPSKFISNDDYSNINNNVSDN